MDKTKAVLIGLVIAGVPCVYAGNPIIKDQGVNDPHIRIFNNRAYLSATHDHSIKDKGFRMDDWWLWSSDDLVNWKLESVLNPEDTYLGQPFKKCWATDIAYRNGNYYWYFSEGNQRAGVVVSGSPSGPWADPLGKPLLGSDLTPTDEYDIGILEDTNGDFYIVFGVWDYYIAKLNEDMVSLAEAPRKIEINNPRGPYNLDGTNKKKPTDDKPFLHIYNGTYYLSWGAFYAMSDNLYGPYDYKGCIIDEASFAEGYDAPTWPTGFRQGRHGSFFEWNNQWFYAYCDMSQTGSRYFRDTFISYIHYKANGEIATIRVDGIGVGEYDAAQGRIEAEDYFAASDISKKELADGGFAAVVMSAGAYLKYPSVRGLKDKQKLLLHVRTKADAVVEVRRNDVEGAFLARCTIPSQQGADDFKPVACDLPPLPDVDNLCLVFRVEPGSQLEVDALSFQ